MSEDSATNYIYIYRLNGRHKKLPAKFCSALSGIRSCVYSHTSEFPSSSCSFNGPSREAAVEKQILQTVRERVERSLSILVNNELKDVLKEREIPMFICSSSVFT